MRSLVMRLGSASSTSNSIPLGCLTNSPPPATPLPTAFPGGTWEGGGAGGAAIFIDNKREMQPRRLHLEQEIEARHRARNIEEIACDADRTDIAAEVDGAEHQVRRARDLRLRGDPRHQVPNVNHAAGIVERLVVHRQPRMG